MERCNQPAMWIGSNGYRSCAVHQHEYPQPRMEVYQGEGRLGPCDAPLEWYETDGHGH